MPKPRPLKLLYVEASFTEEWAVWKEELQRHCEEVYDEEETAEKQKEIILQFKADGDWHFTEDGRLVGITVEVVLRARARVAEEKG